MKTNLFVKLPKNVKWVEFEKVEVNESDIRVYMFRNKRQVFYKTESIKEDFRVIGSRLDDVIELDDFLSLKFVIDAYGTGWKNGIEIMNELFNTLSFDHLFLAQCNLIDARKVSLIGTAKKFLKVRYRKQELTRMMNELGYWDDLSMVKKYYQEEGDSYTEDELERVYKLWKRGVFNLPMVRTMMFGDSLNNPW